jgi:hypothetical protein
MAADHLPVCPARLSRMAGDAHWRRQSIVEEQPKGVLSPANLGGIDGPIQIGKRICKNTRGNGSFDFSWAKRCPSVFACIMVRITS